jgi:integrase
VLLVHAEQKGLIDNNPFTDLTLAHYGRPAQSYLPFTHEEMVEIFAQEMPQQDRLALTLLATNGARLDEIALLEWSQVGIEHGITYLDLRLASKLKNDQSRRIVPVHSKVAPLLKARGAARIFDYRKDFDGKSQSDAGKTLGVYIRNVTTDPLKVVHSFRGTFKDMLKNAGVTALMVEQLEAGEVILSEIADAIISGQVSKELNDRQGFGAIVVLGSVWAGQRENPQRVSMPLCVYPQRGRGRREKRSRKAIPNARSLNHP